MGRALEAFFRHPLEIILLLLVLPVVGVAVAYVQPRSYQSTATLWALQRYEVLGATGPETNLTATPADTQATALSELLLSRSFALSVASETDLISTLDPATRANPELRDNTLVADISHVQTVSEGYNLFSISFQSKSPQLSQQVVQATINNFGLQSQGFTVLEGEQLLNDYQTELTKAQQDASSAANAEEKYILDNPSIAQTLLKTGSQYVSMIDPQYALLQSQSDQAQATVRDLQTSIATIKQEIGAQGKGENSLFKVLDQPNRPFTSVSRTKTILVAGGLGLGLALLTAILYIVVLVRRDRGLYTQIDTQKITSLPVVMQIPTLNKTVISLVSPPGFVSNE